MQTFKIIGVLSLLFVSSQNSLAQNNAKPTLPASIQSSQTLTVGIETTYPPMAFEDPETHQRQGVNVELLEAIGRNLGLTINWEEMSFEQLMSSLASHRIDVIGTAITDLPSRRDALSFVDYLHSGSQPFMLADNLPDDTSPEALCGLHIGAPRSTSYVGVIERWSEDNCVKAGHPAIDVVGTAGATATRLELKQGRLDAGVLGPEYVSFMMQDEPGRYAKFPVMMSETLFGMALNREDDELRSALIQSLTSLLASGEYQKILDHYDIGDQAVSQITVDAGQ